MRLSIRQEKFVESILSPISKERGMSVYQHNVRVSLTKTLATIFSVCEQLVGKPFFYTLSNHYIDAHPSSVSNLNEYGASFAHFIAHYLPARELVYLGDVAQLEWIIHQVLIGQDSKPFDWQFLTSISFERQQELILCRRTNSFLFSSPFSVNKIWEMHQSESGMVDDFLLEENQVRLYIWREGFDLRLDRLTEIEWQFLNLIDNKRTLGELSFIPWILEHDGLALLSSFIQRGYIECSATLF